MHKLNGSDAVLDLDTSDKDTSINSCSDHGEDVVELDDELECKDLEVQDLEYSGE